MSRVKENLFLNVTQFVAIIIAYIVTITINDFCRALAGQEYLIWSSKIAILVMGLSLSILLHHICNYDVIQLINSQRWVIILILILISHIADVKNGCWSLGLGDLSLDYSLLFKFLYVLAVLPLEQNVNGSKEWNRFIVTEVLLAVSGGIISNSMEVFVNGIIVMAGTIIAYRTKCKLVIWLCGGMIGTFLIITVRELYTMDPSIAIRNLEFRLIITLFTLALLGYIESQKHSKKVWTNAVEVGITMLILNSFRGESVGVFLWSFLCLIWIRERYTLFTILFQRRERKTIY